MKQLLIITVYCLVLTTTGKTQSRYSTYNGKKWEQISGNGKLVKFSPVITAYAKLDISHMNAKVVVESGAPAFSMDVLIDENLKDFFRYKQERAVLTLSFDLSGGKTDRWLSENNTVITLKVPALECINNNGNTTIEVKQLQQKTLNITNSGNADMLLSGTVEEIFLQSTGNSTIDAGTLSSTKTILRSSGNEDITVNSKELIEEEMHGNNEVRNVQGANYETEENEETSDWDFIRFKLKNNSAKTAKLTVIYYVPYKRGNGTNIIVLLPFASKSYRFPAGTKIYLATQEQVNTVMSGASISNQAPFLVVKKKDSNKTYNIN